MSVITAIIIIGEIHTCKKNKKKEFLSEGGLLRQAPLPIPYEPVRARTIARPKTLPNHLRPGTYTNGFSRKYFEVSLLYLLVLTI